MRELIVALFSCKGCKAHLRTVVILEDEVRYLRESLANAHAITSRLLHLDRERQPSHTPPDYNSPGRSWPRMQAALEKKYAKVQTPADKTEEYWRNKSEEMEKEVLSEDV